MLLSSIFYGKFVERHKYAGTAKANSDQLERAYLSIASLCSGTGPLHESGLAVRPLNWRQDDTLDPSGTQQAQGHENRLTELEEEPRIW